MVGVMVSEAMAVDHQDQCGGTSNTYHPAGNGISLNASPRTVTSPQLKEQLSCGSDYLSKARKPYTITKQRERWTEDEHKKFLEALKLYGRAWRRIEEHVGTKTAVQIRSHAQKFFSKVVRESSGSNTSSVEPIEIPPPRPKRKPAHPYPRKMVQLVNTELTIPEQPLRFSSPKVSISVQENHSPTSVLSAVGSDALGFTDSSTPNHSISPVSSAGGGHAADFSLSEPNSSHEDNGSTSPGGLATDEEFPKVQKLELLSKENIFSEEGTIEETSTSRSLKLFGRTVLVTESHKPSSTTGTSKLVLPSELNEGEPVQHLPSNFLATELKSVNGQCSWSHMPDVPSGSLYFLQFQKESSGPVDTSSATPLPWWTSYQGISYPFVPFSKQEPSKAHLDSNGVEFQDEEIQKERFWTCSNFGTASKVEEHVDRNMDGETQSRLLSHEEKEQYQVFQLKSSEKSAFRKSSASPEKCMNGFVPYKKLKAENENQFLTLTSEERDEQRIWLCL